MRMKNDYTPKYSLSIAIMRTFMTKKEMNDLLKRYVAGKKKMWDNGNYKKK